MRYKLVVFDFDGTLADSFPWFLGAVDGMADRHGIRRIVASEVDTTVEALRAHAPDELFLTPQAMAERLLAG